MPINPNVPASDYTAYVRARSDIVGRKFVPPDFSSSLLSSLVVNSKIGQSLGNKPPPPVSGYLTFGEGSTITSPDPIPDIGTSDFTIEFFANVNVADSNDNRQTLFMTTSFGLSDYVQMTIDDGELEVDDRSDRIFVCTFPDALLNSWHHYALCRRSGNLDVYVDGARVSLQSFTTTTAFINHRVSLGDSFRGKLTNFRITKSALYPGNVPSIPLSATDSILLLLAYPEGAIVDSSPYANQLVIDGSVTLNKGPISVAPPIFSEYGVLNFNGGDSELNTGPPDGFIDTTYNDITIEWYMRPTSYDTPVFSLYNGGFENLYCDINSSSLSVSFGSEGGSFPVFLNEWHKYAIQRTFMTIHVFIDGFDVGAFEIPSDYSLADNLISVGAGFTGSITNFRISSGIYNDTLPLSGGLFLLRGDPFNPFMDGSSIETTINVAGDVTNSLGPITVVPYSPSGIFTGFISPSTNVLQYPSVLLAGNFTVECFVKWGSIADDFQHVWSLAADFGIRVGAGGQTLYITQPGNFLGILYTGGVLLNTWYHIALIQTGGGQYISINGIITQIVNYTGAYSGPLFIGGGGPNALTTSFTTGSITNFRVSDTARYTTNFTVPSLPLAADTNTTLLLLGKSDNPFGDSSSYNRVASGTCTVVYEPIIL